MFRSLRTRRIRDDAGASAVEMAILLPVLMAILFGVLEYGAYFFNRMTLSQSAREGVRLLALGSTSASAQTRATSAAAPLTGVTFPTTTICPVGAALTANATLAVRRTVNFPFPLPGLTTSTVITETAVMRCGV
ncbi:MAG: TadE family protein [Actinomycetota bacterium]